MTESNERNPNQPAAGIGDIITVAGYGIRTFRVDAINHEYYRDSESEHSGIYYDVTCVKTLEYFVADDDDVRIVSKSANAANYLSANIPKPMSSVKHPSVDDLLLELSDALALVEMFGDDEEPGDGKYKRKADDIKAKIKEQSEVGEWQNTESYY